MEFKKYQHIERIGTTETDGILNGVCYVFPKIDGTSSQLWWNNGLQAGSRNRHLTLEEDNAGFYAWALQQNFDEFFRNFPTARLYGEWLIPHTLKTYQDSAWGNFYVFDVEIDDELQNYETYQNMLESFNIQYIPPICKVTAPTYERLINQLEKNVFLIKDGEGSGEGIVIKNYDYVNKFGRTTWAKIVKNEFKTKHAKVSDVTELTEIKMVEQSIVDRYVTSSLVEKEKAKIDNDSGWTSKQIPRLLNTVYYSLITEESWNFIKEFKNPTIDFKRLCYFTTNKVKELMPQLF